MRIFMQSVNEILMKIEGVVWNPWILPPLLIGVGLFFTVYLGFPQLRYLGLAARFTAGKYDKAGAKGDTSHFQALTTALGATVGTGNIGGVAFALYLGGPPALFWMLVTAAVGMTTKLVEVSISHKYREIDSQGFVAGGPMYYMKNRLNLKKIAGFAAAMMVISSIGTGNMPQIKTMADAVATDLNIPHIVTGAVLTGLLALIILGGIKRIAKFAETVVPVMAILYFVGALSVILSNIANVPAGLSAIFVDVFRGGTAPLGGFLGASFAFAFRRGVNRGLFSNEAGQGSAPIAHASARTEEPVAEGLVSMLEPFIDTIIICMLTGLAIVSSGVWQEKFPNKFQDADIQIIAGTYTESKASDVANLADFLSGKKDSSVEKFSGTLQVQNGVVQGSQATILHNRSLAEEVVVMTKSKTKFTGSVKINDGKITAPSDIYLEGLSLIHSAPLTVAAFRKSFLGRGGSLVATISLLFFAFSTSVSWSYYGDRSMNLLFGAKSILPYRLVYCVFFFLAALADTSVVWTFASIAIALTTFPNLIGLLVLRKEMKTNFKEFFVKFRKEHPEAKV